MPKVASAAARLCSLGDEEALRLPSANEPAREPRGTAISGPRCSWEEACQAYDAYAYKASSQLGLYKLSESGLWLPLKVQINLQSLRSLSGNNLVSMAEDTNDLEWAPRHTRHSSLELRETLAPLATPMMIPPVGDLRAVKLMDRFHLAWARSFPGRRPGGC